jgi:hypothetical protein
VAPQQWLIQATVANESGLGKSRRAGDLQRTLGELWQGIMLESRVGRRRGATAVRVVVDGDQEIAALFATTDRAEEPRAATGLSTCRSRQLDRSELPGM